MNAIEITNLSKQYGTIMALNHMDLVVPEGMIYGIVGSNGAGKSTLIKALVGSLRPTSGAAKVLGLDPLKEKWELRKQIGYMPQFPALYDDLTARENILFFGKAQSINNIEKVTDEILAFTELSARANDKVGTFSGGMKKRVSLCCAMVHNPKILFLDEPTAAIDPHLKILLWRLFRKLASSGVTIFLSTHQMDEILLCDKVTILSNGEILATDTPQKLIEQGKTSLTLTVNGIEKTTTIGSTPQNLASELQKSGLDPQISSVAIQTENIEEIILSILNQREEEI
ncbi:MAG: ABC transporter ATP-binding protein [Mariniphaga sp.]